MGNAFSLTTSRPSPPLPAIQWTCGPETKMDYEMCKFMIELRLEKGAFVLTPNQYFLENVLNKINCLQNSYILKSITLQSFSTRHSIFNIRARIGLFFFDKKHDENEDVFIFTLAENDKGSPDRVIWKQKWPDDTIQTQMEFFTFPTYKQHIVCPPYKITKSESELPEEQQYVMISVSSPFYKAYYDSLDNFRRLSSGKFDVDIYPLLDEKSKPIKTHVKLSMVAINQFVVFAIKNVYTLLDFIDLKKSFVEFTLQNDVNVHETDVTKWKDIISSRYRGQVPDVPVIPISVDLRIDYLSVCKNLELKPTTETGNTSFSLHSTKWDLGKNRLLTQRSNIIHNLDTVSHIPNQDEPIKTVEQIVDKIID